MPVGRHVWAVGMVLSTAVTLGVLAPTGAMAVAAPYEVSAAAAAENPTPGLAVTESEALARAERSGKAVEVSSLRAESSEVFATPDGKLEAREYLRPVRARVAGVWKDIDTDLAKTGEGMVAPKVATVGLEFSGGGDAPMVRMNRAGRELSLSWPGKLPSPQLKDETALYEDVLPGVDLRLGAQEDGFTQLLVVKSAEAASSEELAELRLRLGTGGVTVRETAGRTSS